MARPIDKLRLPSSAVELMKLEAQCWYPREACGFLIGRLDPAATVTEVRPVANQSTRTDRYFIAAVDVWGALKAARGTGLEVLGVYHSHPDSEARPSASDGAEAWGGWLYLIVPCVDGSSGMPRCWCWQGSAFLEVEVEVPDGAR